MSIDDAQITEGHSGHKALNFTVTLSAPSNRAVSVRYATANVTAVAGEDYVAAASTLTFNAGETQKVVTVNLIGDVLVEPDETLVVRLSNPSNATIAKGEGGGVIINDDAWLAGSKLAVYRGSQWYLDLRGDGGTEERLVAFGLPGDTPVAGDWNGDGRDELWVVRHNTSRGGLDWYLDLNGDGYLGELIVQYGLPGDIPLAGDFNGDGRDELAVVRANAARGGLDWYVDTGRDGYLAERVAGFGLLGDTPVVGDFDGNGRDDMAAVRYNPTRGGLDWHIDLAGDGYLAEQIGHFGLLGDLPLPGDWNGDGRDDFGIVRGGTEWWLDMAGDGDYAEKIVRFGLPGDKYVAGDWGNYTARRAEPTEAASTPSAELVDQLFARSA